MNVAYIPVRGGSKSIPLKNIKPFCGKPLVYWSVKACYDCEDIDVTYVATDSELIRQTVNEFGFSNVVVIGRSIESATDTASTESAMLEFANEYKFDNIVLVQATSPLLTSKDLSRGFATFKQSNIDSVLSVVPQKRFNWELNADGTASPINYDFTNRPRRQEYDGYFVENGAFYITSREQLLRDKCRLSGRIGITEMSEANYFEIDEPSDWIILEMLKQRECKNEQPFLLDDIKMFLTDCDGTLTDGGMYYSEGGESMKCFNARDGQGFSLLREHGIVTGIITGEIATFASSRAQKLNLDICLCGVQDKVKAIKELCEKYDVEMKHVAYVGDDLNDVEALRVVGFGACVADGSNAAKTAARYTCKNSGGRGAVREVIDLILNS